VPGRNTSTDHLTLRIVRGDEVEGCGSFDIPPDGTTFGRAGNGDVTLDHPWVSRQHMRIAAGDAGWEITDQGSKGGTRVDTVLLEADVPTALWRGAIIEIGPWAMIVEGGTAPGGDGGDDDQLSREASAETRLTIVQDLTDSSTGVRNAAWERFVSRYGGVLRGYARRYGVAGQELDDIVQSVFVSLHQKEGGFVYDPSRGRLRNYLLVATRNEVWGRLSKSKPELADHLEEVEAPVADAAWDHAWAESQLQRGLEILNRTMRPDQYDAFERHGRRGEPAADVAADLGMTAANVRMIKTRAMRSLRAIIDLLEESPD